MKLKRLHAVYIFTKNVRESAIWYSKTLNLNIDILEDNFALIQIGECELCFHLADDKSPSSRGGSVGYWEVEDLHDSIDIFLNNGGKLYRGPISIEGTNLGICQIVDPFENVIGLQGIIRRR